MHYMLKRIVDGFFVTVAGFAGVSVMFVFLALFMTSEHVPPKPAPPMPPTIKKTPRPPCAKLVTSWYGHPFHGRQTANGEIFDKHQMTAAHRTLKLGTSLWLRNPKTKRTIKVRVNDRGPYIPGRHLDVSEAVAEELGFKEQGLASLEVWMAYGNWTPEEQ